MAEGPADTKAASGHDAAGMVRLHGAGFRDVWDLSTSPAPISCAASAPRTAPCRSLQRDLYDRAAAIRAATRAGTAVHESLLCRVRPREERDGGITVCRLQAPVQKAAARRTGSSAVRVQGRCSVLRRASRLHPPEARRNEIVSFVKKSGLKTSPSAVPRSTGAYPMPFDEGHVAYVWATRCSRTSSPASVTVTGPRRRVRSPLAHAVPLRRQGHHLSLRDRPAMLMAAGL